MNCTECGREFHADDDETDVCIECQLEQVPEAQQGGVEPWDPVWDDYQESLDDWDEDEP